MIRSPEPVVQHRARQTARRLHQMPRIGRRHCENTVQLDRRTRTVWHANRQTLHSAMTLRV
jgi:hypothetical protein